MPQPGGCRARERRPPSSAARSSPEAAGSAPAFCFRVAMPEPQRALRGAEKLVEASAFGHLARFMENSPYLRWKTTAIADRVPGVPYASHHALAHRGSPIHSRQTRPVAGPPMEGKRGTERAMRAMEYLQLDPLQIVARSQDLALHSRVIDYKPGMWEKLCYEERKFFDWGGWLAVRPIEELPHWRVVMRRERDDSRFGRVLFLDSFRRALGGRHRESIEEMLSVVRAKGTVSNRDFAMHTRRRIDNYRGRKDSAVALYYLWRTGELMTHHRERFERVYGLAEDIAPADLLRESSDEEADAFLIRKMIAFHGLHRLSGGGSGDIGNPVLNRVLRRPVTAREVARLRE